MYQRLPAFAAALLVAAAPAASEQFRADFGASIIAVADFAELTQEFCAADPTTEHVLVLPAGLFVDSQELTCASGPYKLYRIIEHDDPDDFEYFLDPPFSATARLGCDGKAGRSMKIVAVNCRPL